jgi:hypothetical protein
MKKHAVDRAPESRRNENEKFGDWVAKQVTRWLGGPIGLTLACVVPGWTLWPDRIVIGVLSMVAWLLWGAPRLGCRIYRVIDEQRHARRFRPHEDDGRWAADARRNSAVRFLEAGLVRPDRQDPNRAGFVPRIYRLRPYSRGVEMLCNLPPGMHARDLVAHTAELQSAFFASYPPQILAGAHGAQVIIRWPLRSPFDGESPRATPSVDVDDPRGEW